MPFAMSILDMISHRVMSHRMSLYIWVCHEETARCALSSTMPSPLQCQVDARMYRMSRKPFRFVFSQEAGYLALGVNAPNIKTCVWENLLVSWSTDGSVLYDFCSCFPFTAPGLQHARTPCAVTNARSQANRATCRHLARSQLPAAPHPQQPTRSKQATRLAQLLWLEQKRQLVGKMTVPLEQMVLWMQMI